MLTEWRALETAPRTCAEAMFAPFLVIVPPFPCLFAADFFWRLPFFTFKCFCGMMTQSGTEVWTRSCRHVDQQHTASVRSILSLLGGKVALMGWCVC